MGFQELSDRILAELTSILHQVHEEDVEKLVEGILSSKRVYLTGMGRSGLIIRPFAMRLMQLGLQAYIVGDAITPAIGKDDLLIAISGSGETGITYHIAAQSKGFGARVFLLTAQTKSRIGDIADLVLVLPKSPQPILPLKSAFEGAVYILFDAVVIMIMEKAGITQQEMMKQHSNLE